MSGAAGGAAKKAVLGGFVVLLGGLVGGMFLLPYSSFGERPPAVDVETLRRQRAARDAITGGDGGSNSMWKAQDDMVKGREGGARR